MPLFIWNFYNWNYFGVYRYIIKSGSYEHPNDILKNFTVNVKLLNETLITTHLRNFTITEDNYLVLNHSFDSGIVFGDVPKEIDKITKFRLKFFSNTTNWILIDDINLSDFYI